MQVLRDHDVVTTKDIKDYKGKFYLFYVPQRIENKVPLYLTIVTC
jgi:hypothetical protein